MALAFNNVEFQYRFRSSQSTADLLTVVSVSDRIARAFKRSGAT